jgi:hypothetical protein
MKSIIKLSAIVLAALTCVTWPTQAQDATAPATNAVARPRANNRYSGIIESIDSANMVLTLKVKTNETKVKLTSTTKIKKDGQPATFADVAVGQRVRGAGKKGEDLNWTATTVDIVTKPRTPKPTTPPAGAPPSQ